MSRMWIVAALPLVLMGLLGYGFWTRPSWANTAEPAACVAILAGAVATGLCVLGFVLAGWWRGAYSLKRGDILAATVFASLDVLAPVTLSVLLWLLIRSLKHHPITF